MTTFFAVRDLIAEKLKEIPEFKAIYTPANSVKVQESFQVVPSAHVNFARLSRSGGSSDGKLNQLRKQWAVTIACRNAASQQNQGNALNDEIGLIADKVIRLLAGWEYEEFCEPLKFLSVSDGYSVGFAYMTLIFESEMFVG